MVSAVVAALISSVLTVSPAWAGAGQFLKPDFGDGVPGTSASQNEVMKQPASSISMTVQDGALPPAGTYAVSLAPIGADGVSSPGSFSTPPDPAAALPDEPGLPDDKGTGSQVPSTRNQGTGAPPSAEEGVVPRDQSWQPLGDTGISISSAAEAAAEEEVASTAINASSEVTAKVLSKAEARKLGLSGLALELKRSDGAAAETPIAIRLPKSLLEATYGADYAGRMRWMSVPGGSSAVNRSSGAEDPPADETIDLEAAPDGDGVILTTLVSARSNVLAATAAPASTTGTGTYAATPLKPSSSWDVSAQTGSFVWSHPMPVPPASGGPEPDLALIYDSQSIDGETGSTNNQPSSVGDGWTLGGSGFIERTYVSCSEDSGSSGAVTSSGDLCWKTDNATMSFGGHSGALVRDSTTGIWKLQGDDGSRVERLLGTSQGCAPNGTYNTECWRLTTTDGTQYFFGLGQLPGWTAGAPATKSTWTVPVFGNDAGEPCHAATFASSSCAQGWRWNLDYVVDTHGNAEAFYYHAETNKYAVAGAGLSAYTRGGQIDHIDYGLKAGSVFAVNAASGKVVFTYDTAGRCNDSVRANCTTQPLDGAAANPANPAKYPDIPFDQNCTGTSCPDKLSPTFWTTAQLNSVTTKTLKAGAYETVDKWALDHSFPDPGDGTSAALWLTQVTHTGYAGTSSLVEPAVVFSGVAMQNRVWAVDGLAPLDKYRISSVRLSTGAVISVNYSGQECTPAMVPAILAAPQSNAKRCFPQWWTPAVTPPQDPQLDLFHKYVVTSTIANPMTGGGAVPAQETYYDYSGGAPAWRYDTSPFTAEAKRTWSVYAGYSAVQIRIGSPASPGTQQTTSYTFYQGMDGDRAAPTGGTKSVSVVGAAGVADSPWLAGRTRKTTVQNGAGGAVISTTTTNPWSGQITASDGNRTSRMVRDADVTVEEPLSTGATRTTTTSTTYDPTSGLPLTVSTINPAGESSSCTTTQYAPANTSTWIIGAPTETTKIARSCAHAPLATFPADSILATRYAYDGQAVGAAPTKGDVTQTQTIDSFSGSAAASAHWVTSSSTQYDAIGRTTQQTDALGHTTKTAYTPAAGAAPGSGPLTSRTVTNTAPFNWTTTTALDPSRGNPTSVTDPNGKTTQAVYDALGRTSKVWLADRPRDINPSSPSVSYDYVVSMTGASSIATTTLAPANGVTSYALFDGLGQAIQTQAIAEGGGTVVTDVSYDTAGRVSSTNSAYWTASVSPSGTLFVPTSQSQIPSKTVNSYDGAGRLTTAVLVTVGSERSRTSYAFIGADRTDMTPPSGGTPTSTFSDSRGQTTKLLQFLAATPLATATQIGTEYTYNGQGQMATMRDGAGNSWSWEYDPLGRNVRAVDPDTGTSVFAYDLLGNLITGTDGRGTVQAYRYDELSRQTFQNESSTTGPLLASWAYDSLAKGQLTSSSSFVGSTAGSPGAEYKKAVGGYDAAYRPTSTTVSIPVGAEALGGTTYTEQLSYYQDGSPNLRKLPAAGGLPAESIRSTYGATGRLGGLRSSSATYLSGVVYTPIGQVAQNDRSGTTSSSTAYSYDQATGTVSQIQETTLTGTTFAVTANRQYTRDNAGNVTSVSATGAGVTADTQCFTYDYLQNLASAWTPSTNACAAAPTDSTIGGAAPYWATYAVDSVTGNRTESVAKPTVAAGVSTRYTYSYPAAAGPKPHAVSTVVKQVGAATPTMMSYGSDASGNTTARPGQTLQFNASGKLSKTTAGATTQKNVYDASGTLLMRIDTAAGATLYLGETELNQATGSSIVTGVRTYNANGVSIAERTSQTGGSSTTLNWLSADLVNTAVMKVDALTGAVTRRYMDPFGNARGAGAVWSSNHGYLNAPTSAVTGLTHLGAREYDPVLGRFISVDAVLAPGNPQQNNGYSYAANNPVSRSDPSGNCFTVDDYTCAKGSKGRATAPSATGAAPAAAGNGGRARTGCASVNPAACQRKSQDPNSAVGGTNVNSPSVPVNVPYVQAVRKVNGHILDGVDAVSVPLLATCMADFAQPLCWAGGAGKITVFAGRAGMAAKAGTSVDEVARALPIELTMGSNARHGVDVYYGVVRDERTYVGITNNLDVRGAQHGSRFDTLLPLTNSPVTRGEARAIEQSLIVDNMPGFENRINSISPKHPYYSEAVAWGRDWRLKNGW